MIVLPPTMRRGERFWAKWPVNSLERKACCGFPVEPPTVLQSSLQLVVKPGAGVGPGALGRALSQAEDARGLDVWQPAEEAQLDQLGSDRIELRQTIQRLTHGQHGVVIFRDGHVKIGEVHALQLAAMAHPVFAAGLLDADAAHRFRGGGEEMAAILEAG